MCDRVNLTVAPRNESENEKLRDSRSRYNVLRDRSEFSLGPKRLHFQLKKWISKSDKNGI